MSEKSVGKQPLWYLKTKDGPQGPFPSGSVRRSLLLGRIALDDLVSDDRETWRKISEVAEVIPPELRHSEGGDTELYTARRREDERSGLDRRQAGGDRPPGKERRRAEPEGVQHRRLAKTRLRQLKQDRPLPVAGLAAIALTVLIAVGYGLYLGVPEARPDPDCAAPPAARVDWRNCHLDGLIAETANLEAADLGNVLLRNARMPGSRFNAANLQYADFTGSDLSHGEFRGARLKGSTLRHTDLAYADLSGADLRYANLSNANLGGAVLEGARLDSAIWLDGKSCGANSTGECRR